MARHCGSQVSIIPEAAQMIFFYAYAIPLEFGDFVAMVLTIKSWSSPGEVGITMISTLKWLVKMATFSTLNSLHIQMFVWRATRFKWGNLTDFKNGKFLRNCSTELDIKMCRWDSWYIHFWSSGSTTYHFLMPSTDWLGATTKRAAGWLFLLSTNRTVFVTVLPPIGGIDPPISHPAFPMWFGGKPCLFPPLQESLTPTEPETETEVEEMNLGAVQSSDRGQSWSYGNHLGLFVSGVISCFRNGNSATWEPIGNISYFFLLP